MLNVSEQITRLAQKAATDQATLETLIGQLDKNTGDTTIKAQIDQLTAEMEKDAGALTTFQNVEKMQMRTATPVRAPAIVTLRPSEQFKPDHLWRAAVVVFDAYHNRRSIDDVLKERYGGDQLTRDYCTLALNHNSVGRGHDVLHGELILRAAQNPAMTNVATYAQELVQQSYAAFMDVLKASSAVAKINFASDSFANGAPIVVPYRINKAPFPNNFEGAFRREGDPIRVGRLATGAKTLYPYSMGVIGHFTRELLRRSTPSIEAMIRQAMLDDTASILDNLVFGSLPAVAGLRPAGLTASIAAADTRPSTGNSFAQIDADLTGMVKQLVAVRLLGGPSTSWVMNTANAVDLSGIQNALGTAPAFPGITASGGTLKGYPVATSPYFPLDQVLLVDGAAIFMAGGTPEFEMSTEATLHEESESPLPIGSAGTPPVVAAPVRSLFQTNSAALRMLEEISWDDLRDGAVQQLTAVAW